LAPLVYSFNFISLRAAALEKFDETKIMENILMIQAPPPAGVFNLISLRANARREIK